MGWNQMRALNLCEAITESTLAFHPASMVEGQMSVDLRYRIVTLAHVLVVTRRAGEWILWTARSRESSVGGVWEETDRFIHAAFIRLAGESMIAKGYDEAAGILDTSCPPEFLDLVPLPPGGSQRWRDAVRRNKLHDCLTDLLYLRKDGIA